MALYLFAAVCLSFSQELERNVKERLEDYFAAYTTYSAEIGKCRLDSFEVDHQRKKLLIHADEHFGWQPFLPETVEAIYRHLKQILPGPVNYYDLLLMVGGVPIEELIPNQYRDRHKRDKQRLSNVRYKGEAWVENSSRPYQPVKGLAGDHIALWQSHGRYFDVEKRVWKWQRPPLFCTTEDLFTQSFVVPYLMPMLERAGAVTYTPRERDTQRHEVVVDNDVNIPTSLYVENDTRRRRWTTLQEQSGFAAKRNVYLDGENPFEEGTARFVRTQRKKNKVFAEWIPDIPEEGEYAVYVSYRTLPESVTDAKYIVLHKGGATEFKVNQQIGGGTWVYLGTFPFAKGSKEYGMVILSNESRQKGLVCADAVRFGGGMGNIARNSPDNNRAVISGYPRYLEAARYWTQWAGMPHEVYRQMEGKNDYSDDIIARGEAVNYLSGGSVYNPLEAGLGVPISLSLAFHTDAGYSTQDKIIGTLGVFTTQFNDGKLRTGVSRYASRDLADIVLTGLQHDIRSACAVEWKRRGLWNRNYGETRRPGVPSMILELLSHQNFADMQLGHDPNFKFLVGRSIYKSVLRFQASQQGRDYVVQPLPVDHFSVQPGKKRNTVELSWRGVEDPLEPSASPQEYIIYTRLGGGGFDNGLKVKGTSHRMSVMPGVIHSFKVTAVNKGGESFPSEILAAYIAPQSKGTVLIVNGFDRISGPASVSTSTSAGFDLERDPGVPYLYTVSYCGVQTGFDRREAGKETKGGWGFSENNLETMKIAGNTFDYPYLHGKAIQAAGGYSFVSCSNEAVESGAVDMTLYPVVDMILGLEKSTPPQENRMNTTYKTFTPGMQRLIERYCKGGGSLFVSGSYVGSDMVHTADEKAFTREVLRFDAAGALQDSYSGEVYGLNRSMFIPRLVNEESYAVSQPDCLTPVDDAFTAFVYGDGLSSAGVACNTGGYSTFVLGFPFESLTRDEDRAYLMKGILNFFER